MFEDAIQRGVAGWTESSAEVVQQIGHDDEHGRRLADDHLIIGDGCSQMRLAAAVVTLQHQPAVRTLSGEGAGMLQRRAQALSLIRFHAVACTQRKGLERLIGVQGE